MGFPNLESVKNILIDWQSGPSNIIDSIVTPIANMKLQFAAAKIMSLGVTALGLMVAMAILCELVPANAQGTVVGFYKQTCPSAEKLVQLRVQRKFSTDKTIAPALLRMHFHDCFVRGCDASLLVDSTPGNQAEKEAGANQSVRGFEFIDDIKKILEAVCPSTVSCADIIALATRDAVALVIAHSFRACERNIISKQLYDIVFDMGWYVQTGGPRYDVPTGRRDATKSRVDEANRLPGPDDSVTQSSAAFASKGLSALDLVTLLGAHTVGITHCSFISDRLYNFQGTGKADPTMDPALVTKLKTTCPDPASGSSADPPINLDQGTPFVFDNSFFKQIAARRGILQIDQQLFQDASTTNFVRSFAGSSAKPMNFSQQFVQSIVKMGNLGVLTGKHGTIRKNCRVVKA